jgi:hypothetical protein
MADPPESDEQRSSKPGSWEPFVFNPTAPIPPEQPIYEGLLATGDLAIWLGREKHRKSCVLLQFAICAALGRPFLHFPFRLNQELKVVLLDYESKSQTLKLRYQAIVAAMELTEGEQATLSDHLQIIEMRKAFRNGWKFGRFPVKPERGEKEEFREAENEWVSFLQETAAGLYIIDPMRCMHAQAENDSTIEALLTRIHRIFGDASVVISHHLRKRDRGASPSLKEDMRVWADEARGSSAITAHADVIVCQDRIVEEGIEKLHLGAYLRDGADIDPLVLRESELQSFLWRVDPDIPLELSLCLDELRKSAHGFPNRTAAAAVLQQAGGTCRSTAFARVNELLNRGLLDYRDGLLMVKETVDETVKAPQIQPDTCPG